MEVGGVHFINKAAFDDNYFLFLCFHLMSFTTSIEKVPKNYYKALEFRAHRRQANQEQATQALTVVIIIQLSPCSPGKSVEGLSDEAFYPWKSPKKIKF